MAASAYSGPRARTAHAHREPLLNKLKPEIRAEILARIRDGVPMGTAARSCGIASRTFVGWFERGRGPEAREPYKTFVAECEQAFADWQASKVREISRASEKDWRAGMALLERRVPEQFAERKHVDIDATVSARPFVDLSRLSLEKQTLLLALLREAAPPAEEIPQGGRPALELVAGDPLA